MKKESASTARLITIIVILAVSATCVCASANRNEATQQATSIPGSPSGATTTISINTKSLGSSTSLTSNYGEKIVPGTGNKFVRYAMYFQNIDAPNTDLGNPYYVTLRDTQGNVHSCDSNTFYIQSQKVNGTTLQGLSGVPNSQPGDKYAGIIVFQIRQNATPSSLTYDDRTNKITINL